MRTNPIKRADAMSVKPIGEREFGLFQKLIYQCAGIHFSAAKRALLEARLAKRIRELGLDSLSAYCDYLVQDGRGAELGELLDRIATNETHFFRERQWRAEAASARAQNIFECGARAVPPGKNLFPSP